MMSVDTAAQQPAIDRSVWKPIGMRCMGSFKADFGQCIVRPPDLVGRADDCYREPAFSAGAVRFAAVQQGGIEAVFDATRDFLRRLKRTDERAKYAATLAALPGQANERAFEMGWSIGVLTAQLARRCRCLLAVDVADAALARARERCASLPQVDVGRCRASAAP